MPLVQLDYGNIGDARTQVRTSPHRPGRCGGRLV